MVDLVKIKRILNDKLSGAFVPDFLLFDEVASTNDLLKEMISDVNLPESDATDDAVNKMQEGFTVISLSQTKGKGRSGRQFFSPPDCSIYLSILVKPDMLMEDSLLITPMTAAAVHEAILEVCGVDAGIKWVNDLYINNRKICGILTEGVLAEDSKKLEYAIIGVGINVFYPSEDIPNELKDIYGTIYDREIPVNDDILAELMASVINKILKYYKEIDDRTFFEIYRNSMFLKGMKVIYVSGEEETEVTVMDVDDKMQLIVQDDNNEIHCLRDGEIRLKLLLN